MEDPHDKNMDRDYSSSKNRHAPDLRMFEPIPPSNLLKIYKGCSNCRTQKIKCNGQEPCSRCRAFGLQCQYIVLPNQAAHRLAALAAATPSPSGAVPTPTSAATSSPSTPSPAEASTPSSSTSPSSSSRTRTSKKKRRSSSVRTSPEFDNNAQFAGQEQSSHSDSPSTVPSVPVLPNTPTPTQNPSGVLNVILHSMIAATDQKGLALMEPLGLDEPSPSPEVMRRLIENYLRYLHPMQCIVDENTPDFWTRLERPMEPEVASIVYAMCTVGAMFMSICGSGKLDDQVQKFYRRTCDAQEGRPHDIITIQTFLILHGFFTLTLQLEEFAKSFQLALDISENIKLGEAVQKLRSKDRLSPGEVIVRNTWRLLVWVEIFRNMVSPKNKRLEPLKDLTSRALDTRPEEVPTTQSSLTESMYFHTTNLFKVFQRVTRIKTPMSPRDVHAVNSTLDEFTGWHCSLPRHLRANSSRSQSTIGTGAISPYAFTLDLYYRVGHILLLNNLPYSIRSSPTGLGPRRESPLRILATSANSITATMGDLVKKPELRNYCLPHGIRSLTEAATIQQFNSKETDPAISTPAKINILKSLWCIRQFNFTVPTDVLNAVLEPFDTAAEASSSSLRRDRKGTSSIMEVDISRPRTPSISAMSMESPTSSMPSHSGREVSMASDYSSSAASTREGSHTTIYETDGIEKDRPFRLQASPSQDGAAASLLALSLESPTGIYRSGISTSDFSAELGNNPPSLIEDVQEKALCGDTPNSLGSLVQPRHRNSRERLYEGKRSRSSSISILSPKIEEVSTDLHVMPDIQPSLPLAPDSPSPSTPTYGHLSSIGCQDQDLVEQNVGHLLQFAPKASMEGLLSQQPFDSIPQPSYDSLHRSHYDAAVQRSPGSTSQPSRLSDFQKNGMEDTVLFEKSRGVLMPAATRGFGRQDRSRPDGAAIVSSMEHPANDDDGISFISASQQRPLSPLSSPSNDSPYGVKFSTGPTTNSERRDVVSRGSLQAREDHQASTPVLRPDHSPFFEDHLKSSPLSDVPRKSHLIPQGDQGLQQERSRRTGPEKLYLNTVIPSHPYRLEKKSPRTPLSASSETGKPRYRASPIASRSGSESDLAGLGATVRTTSQTASVYHNHPSNPPSARSSISSMDMSPRMPTQPGSRAGPLQSSALSRSGVTEVAGSAGSLQEREQHPQSQQSSRHVQPHHLQYWSKHAGPLHEAEEHLERPMRQQSSVVLSRSGNEPESRRSVVPTSSSSPIPAGFMSPLSPQSPRSTREQAKASSSRRSSSATWLESPDFNVGANDEKVGVICAETTPVALGRYAEQLERESRGSTSSHSSSVLVAGRKRPSISMYGTSGMEDSLRLTSERDVSDGSSDRVYAMPLTYNADPLHQDGAEGARLRERRAQYLHHEEDPRRRYYPQDQQILSEHTYVHGSAHAIQPLSRSHHPRQQGYHDPTTSRLSRRSISPHRASPPTLHQRLQVRPSLHHDAHPPRDGGHEVEPSYISSPPSPSTDDHFQGSYSYPQTPVQQHRPAPYYRQREFLPSSGSDPQGRLKRQPFGRESMPLPEHHAGRHHPFYSSHHHGPHYQHHAYHPQPSHSRHNPVSYPCEDEEAAGLSDVLRDPIRRKY